MLLHCEQDQIWTLIRQISTFTIQPKIKHILVIFFLFFWYRSIDLVKEEENRKRESVKKRLCEWFCFWDFDLILEISFFRKEEAAMNGCWMFCQDADENREAVLCVYKAELIFATTNEKKIVFYTDNLHYWFSRSHKDPVHSQKSWIKDENLAPKVKCRKPIYIYLYRTKFVVFFYENKKK